ncbi:MAG: hypothetical protein AB8D52_00785 [Gammaproteobacteria bacterium]
MKVIRFAPFLIALTSFSAQGNDFPTLERVDSVLTCMASHGGQTVENLYSCSCKIDAIASKVSFELWDEARTFKTYKRLPGEKGGLFRDNERAEEIVPILEAAEKEAEKRCFVGVRHKKSKDVTTTK